MTDDLRPGSAYSVTTSPSGASIASATMNSPISRAPCRKDRRVNSSMSSFPPREEASRKLMQVNRRRSIRLPQGLGVSCAILESEDSWGNVAQVTDVSQRFVLLQTHRSYEPGSHLHLTLSNAAELFRHSATVVVRTALVTSDGTHFTGCEFLQALAHDMLLMLLRQ
jgi:hypothetical protein